MLHLLRGQCVIAGCLDAGGYLPPCGLKDERSFILFTLLVEFVQPLQLF
jgi:hypothetical protein